VSEDRSRVGHSSEKLSACSFLKTRREFEEVYRNGASYRGRYVVLLALSSAGISERKVGFVASRKVGGAVQRNRAKRLMRESFRKARKYLAADPAHLVLIARAECSEARFQDVERELVDLLSRASLIEQQR
jgi:ribonuclease P protein component